MIDNNIVPQKLASIDASLTSTLKEILLPANSEIIVSNNWLQQQPIEGLPLVAVGGLVVVLVGAWLFSNILALTTTTTTTDNDNNDDFRQGREPYSRGNYDPVQAKAYYSRHQRLVIQRAVQVFRLSNGFLAGILWDKYVLRNEERNRAQRAQELLTLVTNLGPTAIKIGQALSVRPDLIPEEYAKALSTLQDSVPPFDGATAKSILRRELGPEKYSHLKDFHFMTKNSAPVASASIGQGRLRFYSLLLTYLLCIDVLFHEWLLPSR